MADLVGCVKEIGKFILTQWIQPPVESHFDYWWCFEDNINGLRDGIRNLERRKHYIERKREEARLLTHILCPGVEEWLNASTVKLEKAQKILLPDHSIPKAWNLISRYSLGKNAKKTVQEIENFLNEGNFSTIYYPAPPAAMSSPPPRSTTNFESRKGIEDGIIDSLKQSSVGMIGICGMGGVGKTTMAERIRERVMEEDLFDEVVMVTVSQTIDMPKIQSEIAEWLKLEFDEKLEKHISTRAAKLRTRLMDTKRKIIILDDVWDPSLRFEDMGIHIESNFERCKVLLTSRSRDTCKRFKNKVVFDLEILEEEESWILFKENAGKCVEDSDLHRMAKEVAKECKGLPVALVAVGIALQDVRNIYKWEHSLSQLRQSNPKDFPEVLTNVYKPLKLSYDYLENDGVRNLFLMCCLFPEDYDIPIQQLTWYRMGLELLTNIEEPTISTIEEARNQTHTWAEELKGRSLLIAGKDKHHVKMHDVVRDVAIHIGSRKHHGFLKSLHRTSIENLNDANCNWMSANISNGQMEVPVLSRFPNLRLLMLSSNLSSNQFSDISFKRITDLNVLSFENISIGSLPSTLANLRTLCLFRCGVKDISFIGRLTKLKILSCCGCDNITELPKEIGSLKDLRLLELSNCRQLRTIPSGVISSLSLLEELKILFSFSKWETGGKGGNASLTELERLPNLSCLEIEISDCTLSAQQIRLAQELVRYRIRIDDEYYYGFGDKDHEKVMKLKLPGAVGNWIQKLARKAEYLDLSADGSGNINLAEMEKLRDLRFTDCSTVKKLVDINQNVSLRNIEYLRIDRCFAMEQVFCNDVRVNTYGCIEFPKLEQLILWNLPKLNSIFPLNIKDDSFSNLKSIHIRECHNLRSLFSARSCLLQLEDLQITYCKAMEQVFWNEGTNDCIEFPKLKELSLYNLPNLTAFCQGLENIIIRFPNLTKMSIERLPKLNSLFPLNSKDISQLEILCIQECDSVEQVFWNEIKDNNTHLTKLKELTLKNLPNFTASCKGLENIVIKFPNLTHLTVKSLSHLNSEKVVSHDHNTHFHLFCNPKVEMGLLKHVTLESLGDNIKNIWCSKIPNNFFKNLERLDIYYVHGIKSLMSTSIAKNLVSLENLYINNCKEMVEVIEIDDDSDTQVVDVNPLFSNLKSLYIRGMPKLRWFGQWYHALELPLLEKMYINDCPAMETFTLGSVNTPNINGICVNYQRLVDHKDLNYFIRNI